MCRRVQEELQAAKNDAPSLQQQQTDHHQCILLQGVDPTCESGCRSRWQSCTEAAPSRLKSWLPHDHLDMQGANAQLRGRVQELATELQGATEELAVLQQLRNELEGSASPRVESIVNAAVARERSLQEMRNRKVLELLNSKVGTLEVKQG